MSNSATDIIHIINQSRRTYLSGDECWPDLETLGLDSQDLRTLGKISVKAPNNWEDLYPSDTLVVWHFEDSDIYLSGEVDAGSYGVGYRVNLWTLKEVFPKKVEITVYE